ncbi:MAG: hypothetical protein M1832_003392 [Thelocarpon impressellum]|nr:MAG: hypothetical protein M1832_003392 [Thelocarpon impressellum]
MARRRTKKRTHLGARNGANAAPANTAAVNRSPKSMVLRIGAGEVGPSVSQLVKDVRAMMEPGTASRLKARERRSNRLKDYVSMAGPLGVSHLLLFSRSASGNTNLRLALTPRGPTLHFKVEEYSLCKDVKKAMRHPKGEGKAYLTAPLLVMNNFSTPKPTSSAPSVPKHLESLVTSVFQSLFPAISPQTTPLTSIRRVLLANREPAPPSASPDSPNGSYLLNLRHYAISTKATGLSRGIRRLNAAEKLLKLRDRSKKKSVLPNLGKFEDVADYLLDPSAAAGFTSASESEAETDAEVEVLESTAKKVLSARQRTKQPSTSTTSSSVEKRAIKLVELGPRLTLRLAKVEEGVCSGAVMWHERETKTPAEARRLERVWAERRAEREKRRQEQRENVARKRGALTEEKSGDAMDIDGEDLEEEWDSEDEGVEGDEEEEAENQVPAS